MNRRFNWLVYALFLVLLFLTASHLATAPGWYECWGCEGQAFAQCDNYCNSWTNPCMGIRLVGGGCYSIGINQGVCINIHEIRCENPYDRKYVDCYTPVYGGCN